MTATTPSAAAVPPQGVAATRPCACEMEAHVTRFVAVTGGPGAGKTAVLELARRRFCAHVRVLPEAATMLFGGGFPRIDSRDGLEATQRAIASVQREIERTVASDGKTAVALCDRGTLDGLAYWPGVEDDYFKALGSTRILELTRYAAVIHLRTPSGGDYNHSNPVRLETVERALEMDERIAAAWRGHHHVHFVESCPDFVEKAKRALEIIGHEVPACCRHDVNAVRVTTATALSGDGARQPGKSLV